MNLEKQKISIKNFFGTSDFVRWGILIAVTTIFTVFLYPNLVIKEQLYEIGDVAERDVKATKDFLIEDHDATEVGRRQAVGSLAGAHGRALPVKRRGVASPSGARSA